MCQLGVENGGVVAVITQDSDLIAYGCPAIRTPPILSYCAWRFTGFLISWFIYYFTITFHRSHAFWIVICSGFEQIIFNIDRHGNGERIELEKVFSTKSGRSLFQSFNMKLLTGKFCCLWISIVCDHILLPWNGQGWPVIYDEHTWMCLYITTIYL